MSSFPVLPPLHMRRRSSRRKQIDSEPSPSSPPSSPPLMDTPALDNVLIESLTLEEECCGSGSGGNGDREKGRENQHQTDTKERMFGFVHHNNTAGLNVLFEDLSPATLTSLLQSREETTNLTPLLIACEGGFHETVEFLLHNGASVEVEDSDGWTPLMYSSRYGHLPTVHLLLSHGACIEHCCLYGKTPLYIAVEFGKVEVVEALIQHGADINSCDRHDTSILMKSVMAPESKKRSTSLLLKSGCDVNQRDLNGRTALMFAVDTHLLSSAYLLLDAGADPSYIDKQGKNIFHFATCDTSRSGGVFLKRAYEKLKPSDRLSSINQKDWFGQTPLLNAALKRCAESVEFLLSVGADAREREEEHGFTPLHYACMNHDLEMTQSIVRFYPLSLYSEDSDGRQPFELCASPSSPPVRFMERHHELIPIYTYLVERMEDYIPKERDRERVAACVLSFLN